MRLGEGERLVELAFVMADGAAGFVVSDQVDALRRGVSGEPVGIEIGGRCREVEIVAVAQPVAVPARIPALDKPAAAVVCGGVVDVFLPMLGCCDVPGAGRPATLAFDL